MQLCVFARKLESFMGHGRTPLRSQIPSEYGRPQFAARAGEEKKRPASPIGAWN